MENINSTEMAGNPEKSDTTNAHLNAPNAHPSAPGYSPLKFPLSERGFILHIELHAKDLFHCNESS